MRRDVDFHLVQAHQEAIHLRLENWGRYCHGSKRTEVSAMFRLYRAPHQWVPLEPRTAVDQIDGARINKAVVALPEPHRIALQWCYVVRGSPMRARRALGVTMDGLARLVSDGRAMLVNRGV